MVSEVGFYKCTIWVGLELDSNNVVEPLWYLTLFKSPGAGFN